MAKSLLIPSDILTIDVDYDKTVTQLLVEGDYQFLRRDLLSNHEYFLNEKGKARIDIHSFDIIRPSSTSMIIQSMKQKGFRPGTLKELLTLSAKFPSLQIINDYIALTPARPYENECYPRIGSYVFRSLHFSSDLIWSVSYTKFIAVPISQTAPN